MKKGFSLLMAIVTILILLVISVGFIHIANYTTSMTARNTVNLKNYWAAESASNYNINWWINLPDSVRKVWGVEYTLVEPVSKGQEVYNDKDLQSFSVSLLPEMKDKITGNLIWLHPSSLEKANITTIDGKDVILVRYKAPRVDDPKQAVWVLDSYAFDQETGSMCEIMISNVWNYTSNSDIGWLDYAEAINHTMYGAGINSRKGVYYEWDFRYGNCYFNDLVRFDYKSGSSKKGPTFYGKFHTGTDDVSRYGSSVANPKLFDLSSAPNYSHGIFVESTKVKNQNAAIAAIETSLFGGYERVKPLDTEGVVWTWEEVAEEGPSNGVFFLPEDKFSKGDNITIIPYVVPVLGKPMTYIDIYKTGDSKPTISKLPASKWNAVAVEAKYGDVSVKGVSSTDFTVVTESNNIFIAGDYYLYEMEKVKEDLEDSDNLETPSEDLLGYLYKSMTDIDPQGHLSLISCLGDKDNDLVSKRENSFFITQEETIFMTAALLSYNGDIGAAGSIGTSQNNSLNFFNVGSVIVLDQQEETTGTNSSKFPYALVQDARYLDPSEPIPPIWGEGPDEHLAESTHGLNPKHMWNKLTYNNVKSPKEIVYRFIKN